MIVVLAALEEPIVTPWVAPLSVPIAIVCAKAPAPKLMVLAAADPIAMVPVVAAPPTVMPVAVLVPSPKTPLMLSNKGLVKLVLARPVLLILKLAVWSALFWFRIPLPSAPANCQLAPPFVLLHISVAVVPGLTVVLPNEKLAVQMLLKYNIRP